MQPTFTGINLVADDVLALAKFYAELLDGKFDGDESWASVSVPGAALAIFSTAGMNQMAPESMEGSGSGGFTIEFHVDDAEAWYERLLASGVPIVKPLTTQAWGRRSVWVRDPIGNIINFYQNVPAG